MRQDQNGIFNNERSTNSIKDRISVYAINWPLFLIAVTACIVFGFVYILYAKPKFIASTILYIDGIESSQPKTEDLIEAALNGKRQINLTNEILLLGSFNLMERTIEKHVFNVSYYRKGKFIDEEIYDDAPYKLIPINSSEESKRFILQIQQVDSGGGEALFGYSKPVKSFRFKWNESIRINNHEFKLVNQNINNFSKAVYDIHWVPISVAATEFSKILTITPYDNKSSVINLSVKTGNLEKGCDFLDALIDEFNSSDIKDRQKLSDSTVRFIDERLISITNELKGVENTQEDFQVKQHIVDVKEQSAQSLGNSSDVSRLIKDINIQQSVTQMVADYFNEPSNSGKLVPSVLGLKDPTLTYLVSQYNELQLKKERESPMLAPNSTVMQDLNTQIASIRGSILESLSSLKKNLKLQEDNFELQNRNYKNFLSGLPRNERVLQEMKRKQSITEGLYLYLFQKREEAAISGTASKVIHYKQIDSASGYGPVEPEVVNIFIYCALLGFFMAFGWIYIRTMLNDKIQTREDVVNRTFLPIVGEISHIPKKNRSKLPVLERNIPSEQFRAMRTNLSFIMKDFEKKVILVTSTSSGEGKTSISLNYAAVCAMPGRKVALLEFDIRSPDICNRLQIESEKGITNFLNGELCDISEIAIKLESIPTLDIFPAGPVPLHPSDLLLSSNVEKLFSTLKREYDLIIIDSPPGLVSDAFILSKFSDLVIFIVRFKKTLKKQLNLLNEISKSKNISNIKLVLNDIKMTEKYDHKNYYKSKNTIPVRS